MTVEDSRLKTLNPLIRAVRLIGTRHSLSTQYPLLTTPFIRYKYEYEPGNITPGSAKYSE